MSVVTKIKAELFKTEQYSPSFHLYKFCLLAQLGIRKGKLTHQQI